MPEDTNGNGARKRLMPSNSTTIGTLGGVGFAPVLVWIATTFAHVEMPAEVAAALGSVVGNLIGYFFEGGRKA